jgi:3-phosphoshikimate 1-carboxyvinyltransferase
MKKHNLSLTDEIKGIDKKIASLINQRSRLISRISQMRQHRSESLADVGLEKELWVVWKEELKKSNQSLVRQLYTLLNSLGYSMAEKSSSDKPFCLYPPNIPINLDIQGPRSAADSHYTAFLCALSHEQQDLANFLINDRIIELIKLANQCGSRLSWHDNILSVQGEPATKMDGQNLFINHSLFNFYLFVCLALGSANRVKFNSSSLLKAVNLKNLQDFLPQLGARLYSIEPQSYSLPARLETSGQIPSEIYLPQEIDPKFVQALILSAPSYAKILAISYPGLEAQSFSALFSVLKDTGISMEVKKDQVVIHPSKPSLGAKELSLDPLLSGFLLAMAHISHGKVSLRGLWPQKSAAANKVVELLRHCGSNITVKKQSITAEGCPKESDPLFDFTDMPELAPLAFPLALNASKAEKIEIILPAEAEDYDIIAELLSHIGYNFSAHSMGLTIFSRQISPEKNSPWNSPGPYWTLGYCLLSFDHKGICLANPGNVTSIWPGFWKIFMNLSIKLPEKNEPTGDNNGKPARKRIRV